MGSFKLSDVSQIDYDFREIPKAGAKAGEMCSGHGVIPEPSDEQCDAFLNAAEKVRTQPAAKTKKAIAKARAQLIEIMTEFGVNREHLTELPYRVLVSFLGFLNEEIFPFAAESDDED